MAEYIITISAAPLHGEGKIEHAVAMVHVHCAAAAQRGLTVFDDNGGTGR